MTKTVTALLFLFTVLSSCASDMGERATAVEIDGLIKIKGNEPFVTVVLETSEGREYELTGPLAVELRSDYHLRRIRITGELESNAENAGTYGAAKLRVIEYTVL